MSRVPNAGSYRAVLHLPSASRTFVPALTGRLAYGLFPLATLFTVQQATGSYTVAGLSVAAFGLTSITLPAKARLTDRLGQRRVLPPLALVCAAALTAAALVTSPAALVTLVGVAGLAAPPLGAAMRATWRRLTEGTELKERAYALDSIAEETLYLAGPLLAGLLIAVAPAFWALLLTALLLLTGTLTMVASLDLAVPVDARPFSGARPFAGARPGSDAQPGLVDARSDAGVAPVGRSRHLGAGPLRSGGLRGVLLVVLIAGGGTSIAYTCMAAVAQAHGRPGAAGLIEAGIGLGSVTGGLLWARRRHTRSRSRHLALLTGILAAGLAGAAAAPGLISLGVVLTLASTALAPLFVVAYLAADDLAPPSERTEASTWVNVANNGGNAAGAALAGILTDTVGTSRGFLTGALLLAVAALLLLTAVAKPLNRNASPTPAGTPA